MLGGHFMYVAIAMFRYLQGFYSENMVDLLFPNNGQTTLSDSSFYNSFASYYG